MSTRVGKKTKGNNAFLGDVKVYVKQVFIQPKNNVSYECASGHVKNVQHATTFVPKVCSFSMQIWKPLPLAKYNKNNNYGNFMLLSFVMSYIYIFIPQIMAYINLCTTNLIDALRNVLIIR